MKPSLLTAVIASTFSIAAVAEIKPMSTVPAKPADQVTLSNYTEHPYNHWSFSKYGYSPGSDGSARRCD